MIARLLKSTIGYHDLRGEIDADALKRSAVVLASASELNTLRVGIFCVQGDHGVRYYCRSQLGWIFPSLFHIRIDGNCELVPHPIRIAGGVIALIFLALMVVVSGVLVCTKVIVSTIDVAVSAVLFLLLLHAVFLLFGLAFLNVEKRVALSGFKKYLK
jgi:hypothetical protein